MYHFFVRQYILNDAMVLIHFTGEYKVLLQTKTFIIDSIVHIAKVEILSIFLKTEMEVGHLKV